MITVSPFYSTNLSLCFFLLIVGPAIPVKKVDVITDEEVDRVHTQYMDALQALFDRHKAEFGVSPDQKLSYF